MIGLLVTGHGNFGSGVTTSVNVVAGEQEDYRYVDFLPTYNLEDLSRELNKAMDELSNCEKILVFADLAGGTPFRTAVEVGIPRGNVSVVGGVNMAMLMEVCLARKFEDDIDDLVDMALETGKDQIVKYEFKAVEQQESDDGI